jgi:hypothetical protein
MGCPTECKIGENITFSITTHDPDTGVSTDAGATPTYRIYEDSNETAILNGNMDDGSGGNDEFDDGNTTGLYAKTIAVTAANGFEDGKTYTVFCTATVDSDPGAITYAFKAYDPVIEGTLDDRAILKLLLAFAGGKTSGGGTSSVTFRDTQDATNRIVMVVDTNGNRSTVTLDAS